MQGNTMAQPTRRRDLLPVSTTKQEEEGTSLETQRDACRAFASERGWVVAEDHVHREVYSGAELWDRPQLTLLRQAIRQKAVDVVVCYAIDRLSRDPVHLGVILSEAEHAGVPVEFVTEPLDDSPEGQLIRFVKGYAARVEREKARERTLRGKHARVSSGKVHNHGPELYGYRRDKARGVREIYEPEAAVVRRIFRWVAEGVPIRSVVRRLNDDGIPSPAAGKLRFRDGRAPRWGNGVMHRILREQAYTGAAVAWKYRRTNKTGGFEKRPPEEWIALPEGATPAIVSAAEWQAVQARLASNSAAAATPEPKRDAPIPPARPDRLRDVRPPHAQRAAGQDRAHLPLLVPGAAGRPLRRQERPGRQGRGVGLVGDRGDPRRRVDHRRRGRAPAQGRPRYRAAGRPRGDGAARRQARPPAGTARAPAGRG